MVLADFKEVFVFYPCRANQIKHDATERDVWVNKIDILRRLKYLSKFVDLFSTGMKCSVGWANE